MDKAILQKHILLEQINIDLRRALAVLNLIINDGSGLTDLEEEGFLSDHDCILHSLFSVGDYLEKVQETSGELSEELAKILQKEVLAEQLKGGEK
ncbi:hypothetical protein JYT79_00075 [Cardiobacterium sp. AH-315-I02]|nr:hypothetical protein [Cardiobacterium sp. AH-315-I02]